MKMNRVQELVEELAARRQKVGPPIVCAANVDEAVAVAQRLQELGQAQWFRGQVENWPKLTPGLYRPNIDFARAEKAMHRFAHWVKSTLGLEEIARSTDAMLAIAQHYGMPTSFLDFMTDPLVAGYFASAILNPLAPGTMSCLYCLNIKEADAIWGVRPGIDPERLVLDVPNLWRLEAQSGVFVWCQYDDLNAPFPLDRIVFPYQGVISTPTDVEIYPERESQIESRLREYFQVEEILKGSVFLEEIKRLVPMNTLSFDAPLFRPECFLVAPTPHPSWTVPQVADWLKIPRQMWTEVHNSPVLSVDTILDAKPAEEATRCGSIVLTVLREDAALRRSTPVIRATVKGCDYESLKRINAALQRVWDEMARLPWTDENIAQTVSASLHCFLVAQQLHRDHALGGRELERGTMARVLEKPIRVELGGLGNIHTFAWVDEPHLLAAVRSDFESLLVPENRSRIVGNTFNTLMVSRSPAYLFDFVKLAGLFAIEMIPTQAVFYPDNPLFPTPARVQVIGPE
jgi:hypothetical protein